MSSGITRDDWLKALGEAGRDDLQDDDQALTSTQFAAMFGIARSTAMARLEALVTAGKAIETRKRQQTNGRMVRCRAFRLIGKKGKAA